MKRIAAAVLMMSSIILSGWFMPMSSSALQGRVAIIQPVFTSTAYHEYYEHATPDSSSQGWGSFYTFYAFNYHQTGNITQDLWMLNLPVSSGLSYFGGWGQDTGLPGLVNRSGLPSRDVSVLTDMEVDGGALFGPRGSTSYSAVVLGHEEYVTAREYSAFQEFVKRGGRLIEMSGNAFYGEVNYSASSGMETFWRGHGFEYDGVTAWVSEVQPFKTSDTNWFGSYYYGRPGGTEMNALTNMTDTVIMKSWNSTVGIDSYAHGYGQGYSFCLCVYLEPFTDSFSPRFFAWALDSFPTLSTPMERFCPPADRPLCTHWAE
jgi:hypothetical protein